MVAVGLTEEMLMQLFLGLAFVSGMFFFLYRVMRSKAVFINQDGTYEEIPVKTTQRKIDRGKSSGVYNIRPEAFVKRLIFGVLPVTRIYFMFGCPEPISFHSGKAVYNKDDLKLPVYGTMQCPKCKNTVMKIIERVGSPLLRTLLFETRTESLGKPEGPKFKLKYLVWILIGAGALFLLVAVMGGIGGPAPAGP